MNQAATQLTLPDRPSRRFWAALCLGLFLALQIFATSSALHLSVHADAHAPDHQCAITLLTQGQASAALVPEAGVIFAALLLFSAPLLQSAVLSSFDLRLSPGRAPPRF